MILEIGNTLLSEDILLSYFVCDLTACKGACCVEGDAGAPLSADETKTLIEIWAQVKPFLPESGVEAIERQGQFITDSDGDLVTPLVNNAHCAYTVFNEKGWAQCGIELAYRAGKVNFQKPVSCHLYPIRVSELNNGSFALNYHRWSICKAACKHGERSKVPLYKFLKEPLIRKFGEEWYNELCLVADAWTNYRD